MNLEAEIESKRKTAEERANTAFESGDDEVAAKALGETMNELADRVVATAKDLCKRMVADTPS